MSQLTIRVPALADMPAVFSVLAEYRLHVLGPGSLADPDFPADALLPLRNSIIDVDLASHAFVAEHHGAVAGFCCWNWLDEAAREAKTVLISVRRSHRGGGIGAALQQARMDAMWAAGARNIHTWSDDPSAIAWYQRHFGYVALDEEPIRHALHRFHLGDHTWWAVHRGFPDRVSLTHLVTSQHASVEA